MVNYGALNSLGFTSSVLQSFMIMMIMVCSTSDKSNPYSSDLAGLIAHDRGDLTFDDYREDPVASNVKRPRAIGNANRRVFCASFLSIIKCKR
jgi:hypothetical protein